MSFYDGVSFGSDQIGHHSTGTYMHPARYPTRGLEYRQDYYPNGITHFSPQAVYIPDASSRPWSNHVDRLSLQAKLEDENRDVRKREFFNEGPLNCQHRPPQQQQPVCQCVTCTTPTISINVLVYIFMFIIIVLLAVYHMIGNQIETLKELLRMKPT